MIDAIRQMLYPLQVRLANLVARAVIQRVDDSVKMQLLQLGVRADETRGKVERFQNYGFTSVPLEGAEAVVLFVGGTRDHGLVVAVDDRAHRLTGLAAGEVAVYDQTGSHITLKANGDIELVPSSGNVAVTGTLTASTDVVGGGVSLKNHTHSINLTDSAGDTVVGSTGGPS